MPDDSGPGPVKLIPPTSALRASFLAMLDEYQALGEKRYAWLMEQAHADFDGYVQRLHNVSHGVGLTAGQVPQTTYWLVRGDHIIGAGRLRHRLNPDLEDWGGHIGYDIRPSERRRGYGTLLLSLLLQQGKAMGLGHVLLMCHASNVGSIGVMGRNGAQLLQEEFSAKAKGMIRRYRIELT